MDFSGLNRPGNYRVCVKGIGCSYPFEVADDVWRQAFVVAARGFYHQRSGIALGEPYTVWDSLDQADCAWVYARADRSGVDEKVQRNCREVVLKDADMRLASVERTGFRWAKHPEAFWDVFWDPMVCEYTIQKPLAGQAYVWGYLAARR